MLFDFFSGIEALKKINSQKAEKNIEECYSYLANDFKAVAKIFETFDPLELMKLSLWDERKVLIEKKRDDAKRESAVLLPVMLESVLLSSFVSRCGRKRNIPSGMWSRLKALSDDVVRRVTRIIDNKTALFLSSGVSMEDGENYRRIITSYLLPSPVLGESLDKSSTILRSLLEEKKELEDKTGTDAGTLWINIDNIAGKSLGGIDDLVSRIQAYSDSYNLALSKKKDELEGKSREEIFDIITKENGWEGRAASLAAERDGFDMYTLSSLTDLPLSAFSVFTASAASLDMISLLKMGYWPAMRFPFIEYDGEVYTFVGKHIPSFVALSSSLSRRDASISDVRKIFYRIGVDTYTYDGNKIDISVLPSFYDRNVFNDFSSYESIKNAREEESAVKAGYGHKRLIVDPDKEEEKSEENGALTISSFYMAEAARNRNRKHELIKLILGDLVLPEETGEYKVVDDDELDSGSTADDDVDDPITDEYEYDNGEDEENIRDEEIPLPEYEEARKVDIKKEEERYALPDEILRNDEEKSIEEENYEEELDDDIFDDTEEEERLDEIGEKEESEYYPDYEMDDIGREDTVKENSPGVEDTVSEDVQLDFFNLLDEDEEEKEEERIIDEELEKEDEEEALKEEEKEERGDFPDLENDGFILPSADEEKIIDEELEKEDEDDSVEEENEESPGEEVSSGELEESENEIELSSIEEEEECDDTEYDDEVSGEGEEDEFVLPSDEEETITAGEDEEDSTDEETIDSIKGAQFSEEGEIELSSPEEEESGDGESDDGVTRESEEDDFVLHSDEEDSTGEDAPLFISDTQSEESEVEVEQPSFDETENEERSSVSAGNDEKVGEECPVPEASEETAGETEPSNPEDEVTPSDEKEDDFVLPTNEEETVTGEEDEEVLADEGTSDSIKDAQSSEDAEVEPLPYEEAERSEPALIDEKDGEECPVPEASEETAGETEPSDPEDEVTPSDEKEDEFVLPTNEEETVTGEEDEEVLADEGISDSMKDAQYSEEDGPGQSSFEEEKNEVTVSPEEAPADNGENESQETEETLSAAEEKKKSAADLWMSGFLAGDEDEEEETGEEITPVAEPEGDDSNLEESPDGEEDAFVLPTDREDSSVLVSENQSQSNVDETVDESSEAEEEEDIPASGIVHDIYKALGPGSVFASFVKASDEETLEELGKVIENCWSRMQNDGKDKLFNVAEYSFSILLSRDHIRDDLRMAELLNNAGGVMYAHSADEWTAIVLYINPQYIMEDAMEKSLSRESFSQSDWKRVTYIGEQMKKR